MRTILFLLTGLLFCMKLRAQFKEPYAALDHGSFSGPAVAQSPDPLIAYHWLHPTSADALQIYQLKPLSVNATPSSSFILPPLDKMKGGKNRMNGAGIAVTGKGDLVVDFGVESAGWLEFQSEDLVDSVEMSISEYNEPAIVNAGAQNPSKTRIPVKQGNTYRLELNDGLYEGVRYGWIHVRNFTRPWHIKNVRLVCQIRPTNYDGSFWCNDTTLTRIWYTGAYTVKLNLLNSYFGAILMERSDRQSWTGDAYPAQAAALAAFGNYDMVKANLTFTSTQQDNGIPAYSLYWVLSLIDYFNCTGDSSFFDRLLPIATKRLDDAYKNYDSLPGLGFMGWDERLGAGFENPNTTQAADTYRMLCIKTWSRFAKAATSAGQSMLAAKYEQYAAAMVSRLPKTSLNQLGIHALSEAIDGGRFGSADLYSTAVRLFGDRNGRLSYSPFNQYFILQAMATAGHYQDALETIDDCWGGQIRYGGSTFFEVYRPSWNDMLRPNDAPPNNQCGYTSLAHPWGAGVTRWLSEEILGIKALAPGFRSFTILPHLGIGIPTSKGKTVSRVRGSMPTPHGPIRASFDISSGNCSVSVPPGTTAAQIGLPRAGKEIRKVYVNGRLSNFSQGTDFYYLHNLPPGNYRILIKYGPPRPSPPPPTKDYHFEVNHFTRDSTTSGHWEGRYGRDGYVLFGSTPTAGRSRLPAYIRSVTPGRNAFVVWDSSAADDRSVNVIGSRIASAMITQDPNATLQTMTIDVTAVDTITHMISLYFLDYDRKGRRSSIELFRAADLELIAPVQLIHHYEEGQYLRFSCKGSFRIRINQVRGKNAAVSGLFFDTKDKL